jgi:flagellar hook-basal body complex protein FliE
MIIKGIGSQMTQPASLPKIEPQSSDGSFGNTIKNAINDVNKLQGNADQMATKLAAGDAVEVHQAMIAMQKASQALNLTIQVRNKVIEAYQEIMKTQV